MKLKTTLLASAVALSLGSMSAVAGVNDKGVHVSGTGNGDHYGVEIDIKGENHSVGIDHFQTGGDSVKSVNYLYTITGQGTPVEISMGLSGMTTELVEMDASSASEEVSGYALGATFGMGLNFDTGTSIKLSFTEAVSETRFKDGQVLDAHISQSINDNLSMKIGYRQIDREVNGESEHLIDSGYAGLTFSF